MKKWLALILLLAASPAAADWNAENVGDGYKARGTYYNSSYDINTATYPADPVISENLIVHADANYGTYQDTDCTVVADVESDEVNCWFNFADPSGVDNFILFPGANSPSLSRNVVGTKSGVLFNNGQDAIISSATTTGGNYTFFMVVKWGTDLAGDLLNVGVDSGTNIAIFYNTTVWIVRNRNTTERFGSDNLVVNNALVLVDFRSTGSTKSAFQFRIDANVGVEDGDGGLSPENSTSVMHDAGLPSSGLFGTVMKVLMYDTNLSDADRTTQYNELVADYGL